MVSLQIFFSGWCDTHAVCCTSVGTAFIWGDIEAVKTEGSTLVSSAPKLKTIHSLAGNRIVRVYCGANFSAALDDRLVYIKFYLCLKKRLFNAF